MTGELLVEAVKQVPSLTVLALVVHFFLKEIRASRKSWDEAIEKLSVTLSTTAKDCHETTREGYKISERSIEVAAKTNEILRRIEPKLNHRTI